MCVSLCVSPQCLCSCASWNFTTVNVESTAGGLSAAANSIKFTPTTIVEKGPRKVRFTGVATKREIERRLARAP